jgi:hypothetical protein
VKARIPRKAGLLRYPSRNEESPRAWHDRHIFVWLLEIFLQFLIFFRAAIGRTEGGRPHATEKGVYSRWEPQNHRLGHVGVPRAIRQTRQRCGRPDHRTDERALQNRSRSTWRVSLDQFRRSRTPDREQQSAMNKVTEPRNRLPLRIKPEAISYLASLPQFHGLHTARLIRLAHRRTGLYVPSRWVAISLIRSNLIPIPVADRSESQHQQVNRPPSPPPAKLILIRGRRRVR